MRLCLNARKLAPGKKQHCTNEGNQHPPCVCLRYSRNVAIAIAVASAVVVVIAVVASILIAVGIR
jgi:hypothetical protein